MKRLLSAGLLASLLSTPAPAANVMAGIKLSDLSGIEKTWHLVTVRYRRDNGELRVVYANDPAWEALSKGVTDYPDGARFAKLAMITADDPLFPSSLEPSGSRRFQLMIRDRKAFAETRGWGYALFDQNGKVYPEDEHLQQLACNACHKIAEPRGDVFSRIAHISFDAKSWSDAHAGDFTVGFREIGRTELSPPARKALPKRFTKVLSVEGDLRKNLFQGTLDEIQPLLAKKAAETGKPAALLGEDGKRFTIVVPGLDPTACKGAKELPLISYTSSPAGGVKETFLCHER